MNRSEVGRAGALARWGTRSVEDRFWAKVDRRGPDECWPWTGTRNPDGYGQFYPTAGVAIGAHRYSYQLVKADPGSAYVLHSCDNPPCVNPAHLSLGTHADNLRQASERGLFSLRVPDAVVVQLRERVAAGETVAAVARDLGIGYSGAKRMVTGWLRPHVGGPLTRARRRPRKAQ